MKDFSAAPPLWDDLLRPETAEKWAGLLHREVSAKDAAPRLQGRLCYLATPYSREVQQGGVFSKIYSIEWSIRASRAARLLATYGVTAISPIVLASEMVHCDREEALDPLDATFWTRWCRPLLSACDVVVVPPIAGWRESAGIWGEVIEALHANKQVWLLKDGGDH